MLIRCLTLPPTFITVNTEASEMEAALAQDRVKALTIAFESFDTNRDGSISAEELKAGLEKAFKGLEITPEQASKLMIAFDESNDGAIQFNEFKGVDAFKLRLEAFIRDEKDAEIKALYAARENKAAAEIAEQKSEALAQFQSSFNDGPPNNSDKLVSLLPYLFPLLDSIQYGRFLLSTEQDNPLVATLAVLYQLYLTIPFSGLIAFFALGALSNNLRLNRLVRFNIQQAISLDIGLILPGLIGGIGNIGLPYLGVTVPGDVSVTLQTLTFFVFSAAILYACVSSLLGTVPNKIPLISDRVERRVLKASMFDENGNLLPNEKERDADKKDKDDKK